jgi:hypothetical protein
MSENSRIYLAFRVLSRDTFQRDQQKCLPWHGRDLRKMTFDRLVHIAAQQTGGGCPLWVGAVSQWINLILECRKEKVFCFGDNSWVRILSFLTFVSISY